MTILASETVLVSELLPNPFRDLERLPPKPEKVEVLKKSIQDTTFWDNILVRKAPNGTGGYEIAYGHNRLEALRQLGVKKISVQVRNLSNTTMAQIMARENHEEWGAFIEVEAETVRTIIKAFGAGEIELPAVTRVSNDKARWIRIAPGFEPVPVSPSAPRSQKAYTTQTLAKFLDWKFGKVERVLTLLSFQEGGGLGKQIDFTQLKPEQAYSVVVNTKRVLKETEDHKLAARIGKQLADEFRLASGRVSVKSKVNKATNAVTTETAFERTEELMRESRVDRYIDKKKAKKQQLVLQKQNRQVADFLDACKAWSAAIEVAAASMSKFSPEAKAFTLRRVNMIRKQELLLKSRLGEGEKA